MKIQQMFLKPIDRTIEGVIKADDLEQLKLEVEEYVLTNEVSRQLDDLLDAYTDYEGANGVWISGFFGSGKSHLLKMLALLFENRVVDGKTTLDYFLPKCQDDAMRQGKLKKTCEIPSKSILFNVDQKADTINTGETDALLAVFVKVFNELCGYCGKFGYVAQFERDLDEKGQYEAFQKAYHSIAGEEWKDSREKIILRKEKVAKAYAQVANDSQSAHQNIVDAYRQDYKLSIEDFADQVQKYIKSQPPKFRLNFFVDEVGQYIGSSVKLMTNLQTIAESLHTKCRGQSWIFVTSQEQMDTILGDMNQTMTNDFTKIQARFKNRIKLTSQNVDEVIQKRLLKKNAEGEKIAYALYEDQKNNFGTLFTFTDGAMTYQNYRDRQHFCDCYPFIPYQFTLFQSSIESFSQHNAFEGKHSSVGERSMLGVFQDVIKKLALKESGELAPFDMMFEGIRSQMKSAIQKSIQNAENNLEDQFAIRVLKALFLVKYIKSFNATPRNIRVLLQGNLNADLMELEKKIDSALTLLDQQTYIQRNGEVYEYLTDEEKDIEEEIKTTDVDQADINKRLAELLFDGIIKDTKIRSPETNQDFPFTRKLDDHIIGKEYELSINFISPFNDSADNISQLKANSLGKGELVIALPQDSRLISDLMMFHKTEKYIKINRGTNQKQEVQMILSLKATQNNERDRQIQALVKELVGKSVVIASGREIQLNGEDPKTRVVKGFLALVTDMYPNLSMISATSYKEDDIRKYLDITKDSLLGGDLTDLTEAEAEMLNWIHANKNSGVLTKMKSSVDYFSKRPYGWYLAAIQCVAAMLCGRGKIEIRVDANILEGNELEHALRNTQAFPNMIMNPQATFSANQVKRLKDFSSSFFDQPTSSIDAKQLAMEVKENFRNLLTIINENHAQIHDYPFMKALDEPIQDIEELIGKDYSYYLIDLPGQDEQWLKVKEDVLDPIRRFMTRKSKEIYDDASQFTEEQGPNFLNVGNGRAKELKDLLNSEDCFRGDKIKSIKTLVDQLQSEIRSALDEERKTAIRKIRDLQKQIHDVPEYQTVSEAKKVEIDIRYDHMEDGIKDDKWISVIRDQVQKYKTTDQNQILTEISNAGPAGEKIEYISTNALEINFDKLFLENEKDVDEYLDALKKAMVKAIRAKKRITIK